MGLKWRLGFPLEFDLDKVHQHGTKEGENGVEGSEGRGTSDVYVGTTGDRHWGQLLEDP